jgi:signal transduction histidine kinase
VFELFAVLVTAIVTVPVTPNEPWPWAFTSVLAVTALAGLVASCGHRRLSGVVLAVLAASSLLLVSFVGRVDFFSTLTPVVTCAIAVGVGDIVHGRRSMAVELAREREVSAAERELRSVVEERARIARELHDVVAHHMSMVTVQAETARFRHQDLPPAVAAEFTEIAGVARASLAELRGLLSALRDTAADPHRTPQPTLADLPALAARITAAGTPVTLSTAIGADELPKMLQLAVYRTVQEALSNVVRHATGARTEVEITRTENHLHVTVTNERPPAPPRPAGAPDAAEAGHGLVDLRERTTLLGGTFTVDQPAGGWRVRAELPLVPPR